VFLIFISIANNCVCFRFSDEKVNENFSNYSAWHYRSSLLARTHPDPEGRLPMDEATLAKELDLATNAFYTDPEDQSAWFYTSWLFNDQHAFAGQFFYFV
jgi:geranylgeranyl transferase type-2 subunit alpha